MVTCKRAADALCSPISQEFLTNEKAAGTHSPAAVVTPSLAPSRRGLLEAIKVHHFDPGRDKVLDKFRLRVRTSIDFRQSPELGV